MSVKMWSPFMKELGRLCRALIRPKVCVHDHKSTFLYCGVFIQNQRYGMCYGGLNLCPFSSRVLHFVDICWYLISLCVNQFEIY